MKEKLSVCLMLKILEVVKESGANKTEAECAIDGARALLPELDLEIKPMAVYRLRETQKGPLSEALLGLTKGS